MPPGNDPFAAYGGAAIEAPPPAADPFAAYGGASLTPAEQPAQQPSFLSRINAPVKAFATNVDAFMNKPQTRAAMTVAMPAPDVAPIQEAKTAITDMLPAAKLAKAGDLFQEVEGAIGDKIVPTTDAMKSALDAVKEQSSLGGGGGSIADKIMTRLANTDEGPLTYHEARILHSNLGDLTTSDRMASNPKMLRLLAQLRDSLGDSIEDTAQAGGKLQQYKDAMKGYAIGSQQQEKLDTIIKWAKKVGIGSAISAAGGGFAALGWDLYKQLFPESNK